MGPPAGGVGVVKGESRCPGGPAQTWGTQEDKELLGVKGPRNASSTVAGSECQQREVTLGSRKVSATENPRNQGHRSGTNGPQPWGGPGHRSGLLCGPGHFGGGDSDSLRLKAHPVTNPTYPFGGISDQGSLRWPWNMVQVEQDRLTLVVCLGAGRSGIRWTRRTSPL